MEQHKYFKISEFACKCGCGYDGINPNLLARLEKARDEAGTPFIVTSGCRCEKHNKAVGGVADSAHLKGYAADISAPPEKRHIILKALLNHFPRVGINFVKNFIHVDIDPLKEQNSVFPY